jgi:hypothetical protein
MIEVAKAISGFRVPPKDQLFTLTYGQFQELISQTVAQALEERLGSEENTLLPRIDQEKLLQIIEAQAQKIRTLTERLETLEKLEELYHGQAPAQEEAPLLREVYQKRKEAQESLPSRVFGLEEDLQSLEQEVQSLRGKEREKSLAQGGRKTEARIKEMKAILKASGGSRTFQELERSLGLSSQQFTYLVSHLDKRVFEISRRPGTKRGEKVLSLRVRIREPVVFT